MTALVDGSGSVVERYAYDPFGSATIYSPDYSTVWTTSLYGQTYLWQGRPLDSGTGLYQFRHREVSAALGRPIQSDPLEFGAGDVNFYRWEGNGPTGNVDPSGLGWRPTGRLQRANVSPSPAGPYTIVRNLRKPSTGELVNPFPRHIPGGKFIDYVVGPPPPAASPNHIWVKAWNGPELLGRSITDPIPTVFWKEMEWRNDGDGDAPPCPQPAPQLGPGWIERNQRSLLVVGAGVAAITSPFWVPWVLPSAPAALPYLGGATAGGFLFFGPANSASAGEPTRTDIVPSVLPHEQARQEFVKPSGPSPVMPGYTRPGIIYTPTWRYFRN